MVVDNKPQPRLDSSCDMLIPYKQNACFVMCMLTRGCGHASTGFEKETATTKGRGVVHTCISLVEREANLRDVSEAVRAKLLRRDRNSHHLVEERRGATSTYTFAAHAPGHAHDSWPDKILRIGAHPPGMLRFSQIPVSIFNLRQKMPKIDITLLPEANQDSLA
ncbi:hypothetical protein BKA81DRAFT_103758 [Phyllosticta paracitricarpa]